MPPFANRASHSPGRTPMGAPLAEIGGLEGDYLDFSDFLIRHPSDTHYSTEAPGRSDRGKAVQ
jgi:hypothetical protein